MCSSYLTVMKEIEIDRSVQRIHPDTDTDCSSLGPGSLDSDIADPTTQTGKPLNLNTGHMIDKVACILCVWFS